MCVCVCVCVCACVSNLSLSYNFIHVQATQVFLGSVTMSMSVLHGIDLVNRDGCMGCYGVSSRNHGSTVTLVAGPLHLSPE